jgi:electron transfer flavoprotein alpha subunit
VSVLVLVEHGDGAIDRISAETLAIARGQGDVRAVLFGSADGLAGELGAHGVSAATVVAIDGYAPTAWAAAFEQVARSTGATLVVGPGTDRGTEVMAHVAARMGLGLAANVIEIDGGEPFRITRQRWAGSLLEDATIDGPVRALTIAAHVVEPASSASAGPAAVESFTPELSPVDLVVAVVRRTEPEAGTVALADARVVVGGGRGVGSADGFAALEELASILGGTVGVSRAVTSAGWRPHAEQVGQTGQRIAPDLYIACGISGAIQHIVGCRAAKHILAINDDPEAPIMEKADSAVIGDLRTIVPAISAEIRRPRSPS